MQQNSGSWRILFGWNLTISTNFDCGVERDENPTVIRTQKRKFFWIVRVKPIQPLLRAQISLNSQKRERKGRDRERERGEEIILSVCVLFIGTRLLSFSLVVTFFHKASVGEVCSSPQPSQKDSRIFCFNQDPFVLSFLRISWYICRN